MKHTILLLSIVAAMAVQAMAQIVVPPVRPDAGKLNPAVKKQAAINKILNATVSKVELKISKIPSYVPSTANIFYDRRISLKENNDGPFALIRKISTAPVSSYPDGKKQPYSETYSFTPDTTTKYEALLKNGLAIKIDLTQHHGYDFLADFIFTFYFTDGTVAPVHLQEMINFSKKGHFFAGTTSDLHVSMNIPGSTFPDPANPLVLPQVK